MFKHIIVPLDGSAMAEAALPMAVFFGQCFKAQVSLIHLIEKGRPQTVHDQAHLHDEKGAAAYLAEAAASFPPSISVDYHVHTEEVSHVAQSIVEHSTTELNSDLVIMCIHGGGPGALRFMSGSIAQQVIARGTVPVLAVHAGGRKQEEFTCGKILMPIGGQHNHGDVLEQIAEFAQCCKSTVRLLSVVPTLKSMPGKWFQLGRLLPGATSEMLDMETEETAQFLETQAFRIREKKLEVETRVLRGDPGHCIAQDADLFGAAMIVMATHGKSGMSALWEGSVAHKVFAETKKPILLLPVVTKETE